MASSKLQLAFSPTVLGLDIIIRKPGGEVWNNTVEAFETWVDANIALYAISAVYLEGNLYEVQWPVTMPTALDYLYIATLRISAGVPDLEDHFLSGGNVSWDFEEQILTLIGASAVDPINIVHDTTQIINGQIQGGG